LFTDQELDFLRRHRIGRLATTGKAAQPHVIPTAYRFVDGVFKIGAHPLDGRGQRRLYARHIEVNPRVAFVVDDFTVEPWHPRGVTVKGDAVLHTDGGETLGHDYGPNWIEIKPDWVSAWGIDTEPMAPTVPRRV
jgi:PPOX class F420-dependent enzyme/OxyR family protein